MPANELSLEGKSILDMCCGSRMFWFDKQDERAVFSDKRSESHTLCDGRKLVISPDLIADFTALPFADGSFPVVVFDPPHLERVGPNGWQGKSTGSSTAKPGAMNCVPGSLRPSACCGHTAC